MTGWFLILERRKHLWWRENRCGYTSELLEAGLYTAEECRRLGCRDTPPASEWERWDQAVPLDDQRAELDALGANLTRLRQALDAR